MRRLRILRSKAVGSSKIKAHEFNSLGWGSLILETMSTKDLSCSQCSQETTVFALQPPLKVKVCAQHTALLIEKHFSVFAIAAFDFIKTPEDYPEYLVHTVVDRSIQELQTQVEQRYQQAKEELNSLSVHLQKFVSDKKFPLTPSLEALRSSLLQQICSECVQGTALLDSQGCAGKFGAAVYYSHGHGEKLLTKARVKQAD